MANQRQHKATYAHDKKTGGWNVRVIGPRATEFAGRDVPVTRNNGSEETEKLGKLLWSGIDDGKIIAADKGKPVALYSFTPKPREVETVDF